MIVTIALFGTRVSPRFDCASEFQVVEVQDNEIVGSQIISAKSWGNADRVNKLLELGVDVLICGGLDMVSDQQLKHHNIKAYSWITGEAADALDCLLQGKLQGGFMMAPGGRCCGRWRFGKGHGRGGGRRRFGSPNNDI